MNASPLKTIKCNGHVFHLTIGFYVVDPYGHENAIVAGPFATRASANKDRQERNIADDCMVQEVTQ